MMNRTVWCGAILIAALIFAAACTATAVPASPAPVSQPTSAVLLTGTRAVPTPPAATVAITSILFATATPAARPAIQVFPLSVGATWVYSVTIDDVVELHWTGLVTETITSSQPQGDGTVFQSELQGHPFRSQPGDRLLSYVAQNGRVYKVPGDRDPMEFVATEGQSFGASRILVWPLSIGQKWGPPEFLAREDGRYYIWRVEAQESVTTPAGKFDDCYRLAFDWTDSRQLAWFCPGTGFVRWETHHQGSRHDEVWELNEFHKQGSTSATLPPAPSEPATSAPRPLRSFEFAELSDAQNAATFPLLTPTFIPENLPFHRAWASDYEDGSQSVRILYTVPSDKLDANQKMVDVQLTKTDAPVTLDLVTHQFKVTALDVRDVQVRGQTGYTYWSPAVTAGNSAVLMWREGQLNIKITLFGAWPQPDKSNPHRLDDLLLKIAESLRAP